MRHCDLEDIRGLFILWFHHLQNRVIDTHPADEACILHQPCACGGCINDSYDYFVTHLKKAGGKGRRETGRGSGKVSHHKNKTHTQPRGNWKKGTSFKNISGETAIGCSAILTIVKG